MSTTKAKTKKPAAAKPKKKAATTKKVAAVKTAAPAAASKKSAAAKKAAATRGKKATFKKEITAQLMAAKKQILLEVSEKVRTESDPSKREIGDIYDIASNERERELALILGDRDREKLAEIEDALERISDKTYGECEECGEPIGEGRLKALPFTTSCIDCRSRFEKQHGAYGHFEEELPVGILERSPADDDS